MKQRLNRYIITFSAVSRFNGYKIHNYILQQYNVHNAIARIRALYGSTVIVLECIIDNSHNII